MAFGLTITAAEKAQNAVVPMKDLTLMDYLCYNTERGHFSDSDPSVGVNDMLYRLRLVARRLADAGHRVRSRDNMKWRAGDDTLRDAPGLHRIRAKLNIFHEQLLDELVADGMREWHRARHASNDDRAAKHAGDDLNLAMHKVQLKNQKLEEQLRYQKLQIFRLRGTTSKQDEEAELMKRQVEAHKQETLDLVEQFNIQSQEVAYFKYQLQREQEESKEKLKLVEEMLLQAKLAAASAQASLGRLMDPWVSGTSGTSREYQIKLEARLEQQLDERWQMARSSPQNSAPGDGSRHSSAIVPGAEPTSETQSAITIREATSSQTQPLKEDQDIDMWSDRRQQFPVKHQALTEYKQQRKLREEEEHMKRECDEPDVWAKEQEEKDRAWSQDNTAEDADDARLPSEKHKQQNHLLEALDGFAKSWANRLAASKLARDTPGSRDPEGTKNDFVERVKRTAEGNKRKAEEKERKEATGW